MTKVTKVVVFHSYIFADLLHVRHVMSACMSVCSNERNLTRAHSSSHIVKVLTKRNVEIRHLALIVWGKITYRKVILPRVYFILPHASKHLHRLFDSQH